MRREGKIANKFPGVGIVTEDITLPQSMLHVPRCEKGLEVKFYMHSKNYTV